MHYLSQAFVCFLLTSSLTLAFPNSIARRTIGNNAPISSIQSLEPKPAGSFRISENDMTAAVFADDLSSIGPQATRATVQRTSPAGLPLKVGAIILNPTKSRVLLVKDGNAWLLPETPWFEGQTASTAAVERAQLEVPETISVSVDKPVAGLDAQDDLTRYFQLVLSEAPPILLVPENTRKWATTWEAMKLMQAYRPDQWSALMKSDIRSKPGTWFQT